MLRLTYLNIWLDIALAWIRDYFKFKRYLLISGGGFSFFCVLSVIQRPYWAQRMVGRHCPIKAIPKPMKSLSHMSVFLCLKNHQSFCQKTGFSMKLVWICDYNKVILLQCVLSQFIPWYELILEMALAQVQHLIIVSFANLLRMHWILLKIPLIKILYNINSNMDPWRIFPCPCSLCTLS